MRNILTERNVAVLRSFVRSNVLLAFDYDGTLAPIVSDPDRAAMRPKTRELLGLLSGSFPIAIISGRARADLRPRLQGIDVRGVVGNHGAEPSGATARFRDRVRGWESVLERELGAWDGVRIENKSFSLAVH
jgi:trehalose 6-phosphate phosphatase